MRIDETGIVLKPFLDKDIPLFDKWLNKEYIYKRLCPDGEEQREAWLDEVNGKYDFLTHFIVYHNDRKIGYCLYVDCFFLKNVKEEGHDFEALYGDVARKKHTYEIGYLIGEEEYLNKGIGKIIIRKLEEKIIALGGREIAADPSEENTFSVKALLGNGFKKKRDGDYRKMVGLNNHILPAIAAIIFNEKGEVLLQRRRDTEKWCIICGHIEYGETVENAVVREIMEETDCSAEIVRFIGIYSNPASQTYHYPEKSVQYITSYFEAKLASDIDLSFTNEETVELGFFHLDSLPEDMGLLNENWLRDALDRTDVPYIR